MIVIIAFFCVRFFPHGVFRYVLAAIGKFKFLVYCDLTIGNIRDIVGLFNVYPLFFELNVKVGELIDYFFYFLIFSGELIAFIL